VSFVLFFILVLYPKWVDLSIAIVLILKVLLTYFLNLTSNFHTIYIDIIAQ
jgi:general stress protein CsbA